MWHRDRYLAELLGPDTVRFTAAGTFRNRQVSAYLKGFRPNSGPFKQQPNNKPDQTPIVKALFELVFQHALMTGFLSFRYEDPWTLWRELLPEYQARANAISRRSNALSLGAYTLRDFKNVYAALMAICAAHEHLCYAWKRNNREIYPKESAVMIRSDQEWARVLAELSSIDANICRSILGDLSFDFAHSTDMHVTPFVTLNSSMLALAPHFPLHSHGEENILRICSALRPGAFDITSLRKEPDLLNDLKARLPHRNPLGLSKCPSAYRTST